MRLPLLAALAGVALLIAMIPLTAWAYAAVLVKLLGQ